VSRDVQVRVLSGAQIGAKCAKNVSKSPKKGENDKKMMFFLKKTKFFLHN